MLINDIETYTAAPYETTGIDDDATITIAGQLVAMDLQDQALGIQLCDTGFNSAYGFNFPCCNYYVP